MKPIAYWRAPTRWIECRQGRFGRVIQNLRRDVRRRSLGTAGNRLTASRRRQWTQFAYTCGSPLNENAQGETKSPDRQAAHSSAADATCFHHNDSDLLRSDKR